MPYAGVDDLRPAIRDHLPEHAQHIIRAAFDSAWIAHENDPRREAAAHRIAWGAVRRACVKDGDSWVERGAAPE